MRHHYSEARGLHSFKWPSCKSCTIYHKLWMIRVFKYIVWICVLPLNMWPCYTASAPISKDGFYFSYPSDVFFWGGGVKGLLTGPTLKSLPTLEFEAVTFRSWTQCSASSHWATQHLLHCSVCCSSQSENPSLPGMTGHLLQLTHADAQTCVNETAS